MSGYIYFIGEMSSDAIKVGFSASDPLKRLRTMQTGNSDRLVLLGHFVGTREDERRIHMQFAPYCVRGEWFRLEGEFKDYFDAFTRRYLGLDERQPEEAES